MFQRFAQRSELQPWEHSSAREKSFAALSSKPPQFFVPRGLDLAGRSAERANGGSGSLQRDPFSFDKVAGVTRD
ncbi:unnamed protein product [Sphagnum troendelagicum]